MLLIKDNEVINNSDLKFKAFSLQICSFVFMYKIVNCAFIEVVILVRVALLSTFSCHSHIIYVNIFALNFTL